MEQIKKQEKSKKFKRYIVYWSPINKPQVTENYICWARNPQDAICRAKKTTRSKATMYCEEMSDNNHLIN